MVLLTFERVDMRINAKIVLKVSTRTLPCIFLHNQRALFFKKISTVSYSTLDFVVVLFEVA